MEYLISTIFLVAAIASGQMFPNAGVGPGIPSGPGPGTAMGPSGQASPGASPGGSFGPSGQGLIPPNPYFDQAATALPQAPTMDPSTENCILQFCGYGCTSPTYAAVCNSSALNVEVKKFFQKLQLFQGSLPLILMLEGKRDYSMDLFAGVKDNLVSLIIGKYGQFNTAALKKLNLPTLLALQIRECKNVTVGPTDFLEFSRLRQLSFIKSTVFSLAKKALQPLTSLQLLAMDGNFEPPFSGLEVKHLEQFHCDCKYSWLRDYIRKNPLLIQPKKEGDLFKVGMLHSEPLERSDIFYPVNCTIGVTDEPLDLEETATDVPYSCDDVC